MDERNEEIKEEVKNTNNQELNNNEKEPKKEMKIKVWVLLVILIILVVIGIVTWGKITEDNCENSTKIHNGNGTIMIDGPMIVAKPIIYIYPQEEIEISVKLGYPEKITCSYPKYVDGWNVIARPEGNLIDKETERNLYALYWEGINTLNTEIKDGFVVKGEDTIKFLEEKLEILGLNEIEAEEFIVYWLPKLEANKYNYIRFATMEEINEDMPLEFSVEPDTLIRVLMEFKGLEEYIEVPEQKLETPERKGFVVVEWGGTELK